MSAPDPSSIEDAEIPQVMSAESALGVEGCGLPQVCASSEIACKLLTYRTLDWHLLPCVITLRDIIDSLPGNIGWNDLETKPLTDTPWSYAPFVDRYVSPGTPDWSEGRLLCRQCVLKLMGCRVLNSLRELKAQSRSSHLLCCGVSGSNRACCLGGQQVEDCWYGYNCRTQRRPYHGAKLNVRDG